MLEEGWHEYGLVWGCFLPNLRPLGCFLLAYLGVVILFLLVTGNYQVVVTGVKRSQLLVLKLAQEFNKK